MECELIRIVGLGSDTGLVLGRVLAMHIRDDVIIDPNKHYIDTPRLRLIARMHTGWYTRTSNFYRMAGISQAEWRVGTTERGNRVAVLAEGAPRHIFRPGAVMVEKEGIQTLMIRRSKIMEARMKNPAMIVPGAMEALQALAKSAEQCGVPQRTLALVHLRASQINGCGVCVDMAFRYKKASDTDERLFAVAAWRDTPYFSEAERAALALSEAVTRLSDRPDPVPDGIWQEAARHYSEPQLAALILWIAMTNIWNRLNVSTRQVAGEWAKSAEAQAKWRGSHAAAH